MGKSYLSEREYQKQLARIKRDNLQKERQMSLDAEKNKYRKSRMETNKLMAIYLFALLNAIVVYSMVAMWVFADFTYLGVLISDIAAQVLIYAIYCIKAYHGKKQSENMKFERERLAGSLNDILAAGSECGETVPLKSGMVDAVTPSDEAVG